MKFYRTDKIVKREKVVANPDVLYLFGDNLIRKGLGGQAKEMRGEPNCVGIVTKKYPSMKDSSFYTNHDYPVWVHQVTLDFAEVVSRISSGKYKAVVVPPMGVGLADLPNRAPLIWKKLQETIDKLEMLTKYF